MGGFPLSSGLVVEDRPSYKHSNEYCLSRDDDPIPSVGSG